MALLDFLIAVRKPEALDASLAALGAAVHAAGGAGALRELLCVQFSDLFHWHAQTGRVRLNASAPLIDFVARPAADTTGHECAMRPTQRLTDLVLAVADLTGATVDFTEGWPVIAAQTTGAIPAD